MTTPTRQVLDPAVLAPCFPSSELVKRYDAARRVALLQLDDSYALNTQTRLMPLVRAHLESTEALFLAYGDLEREHLEVLSSAKKAWEAEVQWKLNQTADSKRACKEAKQAYESVRTRFHMTVSNVEKLHRNNGVTERALESRSAFTGAGGGGAAVGSAGLVPATAPPKQDRYVKCTRDECAGGMFCLKDEDVAPCLVCSAPHCTRCLVFLLGEDQHVCVPDDVDSARYILTSTKSCPKCFVNISRISGCNQMCCTTCLCFFDWQSGRPIDTSTTHFHNPHFMALSEDMRAKAVEMNGGNAGPQQPQLPFDPFCEPWQSQRIFNEFDAAFIRGSGDGHMLREAFRSVNHARLVDVPKFEAKIEGLEQESHFRMLRIARLLGRAGVGKFGSVLWFNTFKLYSRPTAAPVFKLKPVPLLSDEAYAKALLTADTRRQGLVERIAILTTYADVMETLIRTALAVPAEERDQAAQRILEYSRELGVLLASTTKTQRLSNLRAARTEATGTAKRKRSPNGSGTADTSAKGKGKAKAKPAKRGKQESSSDEAVTSDEEDDDEEVEEDDDDDDEDEEHRTQDGCK